MNDRYTAICERIRERCQQKKYYGPDGGWQDYRGYFDADGRLQVRDLTHDPHTGFEFPPATEEQLSATEEAIGLSLPPMVVLDLPKALLGLVEATILGTMVATRRSICVPTPIHQLSTLTC